MKEKNADLENSLALAKVKFEGITTQKEELLRKISKDDDEIETFLQKESLLKTK